MYLAQLNISNFRKVKKVELHFQPGLNILVGANNVGKTAIVDALRALLAGQDEPYPRFDTDDIHRPYGEPSVGDIEFQYIFKELDEDNEADFLQALKPNDAGKLEAYFAIRYTSDETTGRLKVKRWCGDHEDVGLTSEMMENLRGVYLQPLRDASQSLKPSRTSQLSRLFQLLTDKPGQEDINLALKALDDALKLKKPISETLSAIQTRHKKMLGEQFFQDVDLGLSGSDFQRLASRISLIVNKFEIEQNGLGFNNLIFMAVVLSELIKNQGASYRGLIIEEPEAHLHPQLQAVLLDYLEGINQDKGERPVQLFVTSHSPNFASIAPLNSLNCLVDIDKNIEAFSPRTIKFEKGKSEKLGRYLDVTRAEIFFARRIIFVEGAAELMLVNVLAKKIGYNLRQHGISLISVEGLNFDSFLPLFGENSLKIPVSVITDADPVADTESDDDEPISLYPAIGDIIKVSDNTAKMKDSENLFIKVFHGVKTFEYDLALYSNNRAAMLMALKDIHPKIHTIVEKAVNAETDDAAKAKALFCGMFERKQNNVQKGKFGQALAQVLEDGADCTVPDYINKAIEHACQKAP